MWNPQKLQAARKAASLTQEELARRVSCSLTALRNWEKGRMVPSYNAVVLVSRVTGKSLEYFNEGGS